MYWSLRRELWENRSVYLGPLIIAALVLFGSLISVATLPHRVRNVSANDPIKLHSVITKPFAMAPAPIMLASFIIGLFYSLDALYGERRDRSILFWKSLPVSDLTTVLAKIAVPIALLPLIALAISIVTFFILFAFGTLALMPSGNTGALWRELRFVQEPLVMLYGLTVHSLWFAPIYSWLLLVSAWARRMPVLWALLPPAAVAMVERMALGTTYFGNMLRYRVVGAMREAFSFDPTRPGHAVGGVMELSPLQFLSAPGLWVGLIFAALCLVAAVRLRRNREPI
jgi:ABC-2 type transport system permease protein